MSEHDALVKTLALLDDMANRSATMGWEDIADLCEARETIAEALNFTYDDETGRFQS